MWQVRLQTKHALNHQTAAAAAAAVVSLLSAAFACCCTVRTRPVSIRQMYACDTGTVVLSLLYPSRVLILSTVRSFGCNSCPIDVAFRFSSCDYSVLFRRERDTTRLSCCTKLMLVVSSNQGFLGSQPRRSGLTVFASKTL